MHKKGGRGKRDGRRETLAHKKQCKNNVACHKFASRLSFKVEDGWEALLCSRLRKHRKNKFLSAHPPVSSVYIHGTGQERRTDAAETAPAGKETGRKSKGRENAVSMYRAIIRYPLEDVEMRELYDNKEDARLDAMIAVTFRYMEAEERYKDNPEMFKCAGDYVLHSKLVLREVVGEEEKPGKILPFPEKQ